jgi:rod shape-determining protein MreC
MGGTMGSPHPSPAEKSSNLEPPVPRNRTVRLAVLGSSVQRSAAAKYPSRSGTAFRRRLVVGLLVVLSLMLMTIYFRESPSGGLHTLQDTGATALRPFQVVADRVAQPFEDVYGYFSGLADAKSEAERLREENARLRQLAIQNETLRRDNDSYKKLLDLRFPAAFPDDFRRVAASVTAYPPSQFEQRVVIAAGWNDGIRRNDAVVNGDGLVGKVVQVGRNTSKVLLLTDQQSAAAAVDIGAGSSATGLVVAARAGSGALILDNVDKDEHVQRGDEIITKGTRVGELESLYPRGIAIGVVTFVNKTDIDPFQRIQLQPYVDFESLDQNLIVLVPKGRT